VGEVVWLSWGSRRRWKLLEDETFVVGEREVGLDLDGLLWELYVDSGWVNDG